MAECVSHLQFNLAAKKKNNDNNKTLQPLNSDLKCTQTQFKNRRRTNKTRASHLYIELVSLNVNAILSNGLLHIKADIRTTHSQQPQLLSPQLFLTHVRDKFAEKMRHNKCERGVWGGRGDKTKTN